MGVSCGHLPFLVPFVFEARLLPVGRAVSKDARRAAYVSIPCEAAICFEGESKLYTVARPLAIESMCEDAVITSSYQAAPCYTKVWSWKAARRSLFIWIEFSLLGGESSGDRVLVLFLTLAG
jgi:hypothetical protein